MASKRLPRTLKSATRRPALDRRACSGFAAVDEGTILSGRACAVLLLSIIADCPFMVKTRAGRDRLPARSGSGSNVLARRELPGMGSSTAKE